MQNPKPSVVKTGEKEKLSALIIDIFQDYIDEKVDENHTIEGESYDNLAKKIEESIINYDTEGYTLYVIQEKIDDQHQDSLWYGGRVAEIEHRGYTFIIGAYGDVRATLFDEYDEYDVIAEVIDKNNLGEFASEMGPYIKSDEDMQKLEDSGRLVFENNNWFEILVDGPNGTQYDTGWVVGDYTYDGAIKEVLDEADAFIERIESDGKENEEEAAAEAECS